MELHKVSPGVRIWCNFAGLYCLVELMIVDAKSWRVYEVGHLEQFCGGRGSSVLVETLVELSVI